MQVTKRERLIMIVILGCIASLGPFTIDMYLPAFPKIADTFNETKQHISYTLTSYFLGISLGQLMYGPLLEKFGRKKPLVVGLAIYVLASLIIAFSVNLEMMMALRFMQAMGASVGMVAGKSMVRDRFETVEVARILSSILLVMGVAPIIAPTLGGFLIQHFGWQSIFIFLFVLGAMVLGSVVFFLQETRGYDETVILRLKPITQSYLKTLQDTNFFRYTLASSFALGILFSYIPTAPFVFMDIYKVSESVFGILFGLNAGGFILGSQINRFLLKKVEIRHLTNFIVLLMAILSVFSLILVSFVEISLVLFCILTFSILFLLGFVNPNATALSLDKFKSNIGIANALNGSLRMAMGAIISALIGYCYNGTMIPMFSFVAVLCVINLGLFWWANNER